jgi:ketosteroid isomerase-like protein
MAAAHIEISGTDPKELHALNSEYIRSVQESDVGWFERNLADGFVCCRPDGSFVDRSLFLKQTALPAPFSNLEVHEVMVRVLGDFALIHARTTFTRADGTIGANRYTDAWARQQGRWQAVCAHITPVR